MVQNLTVHIILNWKDYTLWCNHLYTSTICVVGTSSDIVINQSINQSIYLSKCKTNTGPDTKGGYNLR